MDYPGTLDLLAVGQAGKEETANALFSAFSPAVAFGRRASTSAGLTWGYYGGNVVIDNVPTMIANGTVTLTDDATCYVRLSTAGVVDHTTDLSSNWPEAEGGYTALYTVTTAGGACTAWQDHRTTQGPQGPAGAAGATGATGATGAAGANGEGVPAGGSAGEILAKIDGTDFNTEWISPSSAGDYVQLAQTVTASSASIISFTSISGAYSNLRIVISGRYSSSVGAGGIWLMFNSDATAGNYADNIYTQTVNTTVSGGIESSSTLGITAGILVGTQFDAQAVSQIDILVAGYAGTTFHKTFDATGMAYGGNAGNTVKRSQGGRWKSTSAITRIDLNALAGHTFADGTTATLYGMV